MCNFKGLFLFLVCLQLCCGDQTKGQDVSSTLKKIRQCLAADQAMVCLKERALDALNDTIMSDKPITLYGAIDIVKDPNYIMEYNSDSDFLPGDVTERSLKLNDLLYTKIEEFLSSRTIKIHLANIVEGRGKKDKNKGGMLMMGGLAMAGMMAQMFMGKIAFMAGAALLIAKVALMLSTVIGFKKLSSGSGGGESAHVVYASGGSEGYGHSHGGGGWHRSIAGEETDNNPYRAHVPEVTDNYTY